MPARFLLERTFVRDERGAPNVFGLVELGILPRLAFGESSDERLAAKQIHRLLKKER